MCSSNYARNTQFGSVMLAVLAMGTLSSVALLTMMFSISSMKKNLTLAEIQDEAKQVLINESSKYMSNYLPDQDPNNHVRMYQLTENGIDYSYRQNPDIVRVIDWPMPGYSFNSNYKTKLVSFESQIKNNVVQTPLMFTGWQCTEVSSAVLSTEPQLRYTLGNNDNSFGYGAIDYEFHQDTGRILRTSNAGTQLLADMDFETGQRFSRADFTTTSNNEKLKIVMTFAVTRSDFTTPDQSNALYILFDETNLDLQHSRPILINELAKITSDYKRSGHERGLILHLDPGQLILSAITTVSGQTIFITQSMNIDYQTGQYVYKNKLYQINLSPAADPVLFYRSLVDSKQLLNLKTNLTNHNLIVINTQSQPSLLSIPATCRVVFKYEK